MRVYYDTNNEIPFSVYDSDIIKQPSYDHSYLVVDETEANRTLCQELHDASHKTNDAGETRYYIDGDGDLAVRDGWIPGNIGVEE